MKARNLILEDLLPVKLLARLNRSEDRRPAAIQFTAAVMFIDVSRYTALVEQLARRGQEGLEDLPRLLSLSYGRCAEHIDDLGGEVLYFAGDSLLAYWPSDADDLGCAVRSAVACAEMICQGGSDVKHRVASEIYPALHLGIGAGRLWSAALGEHPTRNLIAGGEAVTQAAASQAVARSWGYVLSTEATQILAREVTTATNVFSRRHFETCSDIPSVDWMTQFLPMQVREILLSADSKPPAVRGLLAVDVDPIGDIDVQLAELSEIRPVSALFARIVGLNCSDALALPQHQTLYASLEEVVRARGGPPGNLYYDDKGLVFSTTFGARGSFHRDDARRAVNVAHAINQAVDSLGLSSSIGVATGEALFGFVGSMRRRQFMTHGAPINRAARLMMANDRGILCDAPTERASRSAFRFEPKGTLQLTGLGDMAAVFCPVESYEASSSDIYLVGRLNELDLLKRTFEEVQGGGKRLLVIMGESGIGKSTLVASFTETLRSTGTTVAVARAERDDRRTSFLPWRRLLGSILNLAIDIDAMLVLDALSSRLGNNPRILERLPLLDGVLGIDINETESTRHLQGAHRGDATMRLVADLLDVIAPCPLVLVLEDSQWLDSASWRLVERVVAGRSSILAVLCVRSEEIPEDLRNLQRRAEAARVTPSGIELDDPARFCRILEVEELHDTAICELAARTLGDATPDRELAERISALACGNPLFAEEISLTLKTEGLIAIREGCWRSIRPLDDLRYFERIERVIRERVDGIEPKALDVLKACAVIGRSFLFEALEVVLKDESKHTIQAALNSLVAAHFLRKNSTARAYEFRHDQIRDVVYASIPADVRQRLHGILADWLEQTEETATGADIAILAQHFEAAGNKDKAVTYAESAATKALQAGAFREVEAFLAICFSHESRQMNLTNKQRLRAVRWRAQLAESHYSRGDIYAQGVAIRRALTLAGETIPRSRITIAARIARSACRLLFQQMLPRATPESGKAWEQEMARCHNQAVMVDYFELRFLEGMRHLIEAVVHAERAGITRELAVASSQMACGLGILGQKRLSKYFMRKADRAAVTLGDPAIHSHVCNLDALWQVGRCHWEMVDRRLNQSQDLSLRAGDQLRWSNAQVIRFWSLFYRGDWNSLEQTAQGLLSRAQSSGNVQQENWALRCKSLCALHADRPREAIEILRLITSAMLGSADLAAQVSTKGSLALALSRIGLNDESLQAVEETLRILRGMRRPTGHVTLVGISGVCEVLFRGRETALSREYDQWSDWEAQALNELKRYSHVFPVGKPQYGLWAGVALWLEGRKDRALIKWNEALSVARRLSLRHDEAMIAAEIRRRQDRL